MLEILLCGWFVPVVVSLYKFNSLISFLSRLCYFKRVNIWSTKGAGCFRIRPYVKLPSWHWQRDLHHICAHEKSLILHSQNLPLPLNLWTSIKPFITMQCISFHFPNIGGWVPSPLPSSASVHLKRWVYNMYHVHWPQSQKLSFPRSATLSPQCTVWISHKLFLLNCPCTCDNTSLDWHFIPGWHILSLFFLFFSSCPIYPWDEKQWSWFGAHSSAKVWGSCCASSNIWVVQGWEKVSPALLYELFWQCVSAASPQVSTGCCFVVYSSLTTLVVTCTLQLYFTHSVPWGHKGCLG